MQATLQSPDIIAHKAHALLINPVQVWVVFLGCDGGLVGQGNDDDMAYQREYTIAVRANKRSECLQCGVDGLVRSNVVADWWGRYVQGLPAVRYLAGWKCRASPTCH